MSISEQEALARQLWALHQEALGGYDQSLWTDELTSIEREAWIQVAQFVEARNEPLATDDNPIVKAHLVSGYDEPDHK